MPRFNLKDLFISTAMVAIGLATALFATHFFRQGYVVSTWIAWVIMWVIMYVWVYGCAIVGAGLLHPFGMSKAGLIVGGLVGLSVLLMALLGIF